MSAPPPEPLSRLGYFRFLRRRHTLEHPRTKSVLTGRIDDDTEAEASEPALPELVDYESLLALLEREHRFRARNKPPWEYDRHKILDEAYSLNVQQAKLELYTDFLVGKIKRDTWQGKADSYFHGEEPRTRLAENISRYSRALTDYQAFLQYDPDDFTARSVHLRTRPVADPFSLSKQHLDYSLDDRLQAIAVRKAAVRCCGLRLSEEQPGDPDTDSIVEALLRNHVDVVDAQERAFYLELATRQHSGPSLRRWQEEQRAEKLAKEQQYYDRPEKFMMRTRMAMFGGLILVAPMLIMRLHPDLLTVVLTTSIFVVVVGILLAYLMTESDAKDILVATAAYAAVLVVFVGPGTMREGSTLNRGQIAGLTIGVTVAVWWAGTYLIFRLYFTRRRRAERMSDGAGI